MILQSSITAHFYGISNMLLLILQASLGRITDGLHAIIKDSTKALAQNYIFFICLKMTNFSYGDFS